MAVKPIPDGHPSLIPHLTVDGAAEAIEFYKNAFGAEELYRSTVPGGAVIHAELRIGDAVLFLNDAFGPPGPKPAGAGLHLWVEDADAAWERAVKAGAQVKMPLENQFWGDRYGQLTDPFGFTWSIGTHVEDVTPEDMARRAAELFGKSNG